jgi:hypothetical protein
MAYFQKRIAIVLGVALAVVAGHAAFSYHKMKLAAAQLETTIAQAHADSVLDYAANVTGELRLAEWRADQADARADTAEAQAKAAEKRAVKSSAQLAVAAVPDTCKQLKALADSAIANAEQEADAWQAAAEQRSLQAAELAAAKDSAVVDRDRALGALKELGSSSSKLQKASKVPFLARITPKVGVGGAVGLDVQRKPNAVVGITLGWTFR